MCLLVRDFRVVRGYGLFRIAVLANVSVVLPSEFMHIPDFRAIVKFSAYGVSEVEIPREFYEVRGEHLVDGSGTEVQATFERHEESDKCAKES